MGQDADGNPMFPVDDAAGRAPADPSAALAAPDSTSPPRSASILSKLGALHRHASWKPLVAVYASVPLGVVAAIWLAADGHLGGTPVWVLATILAITAVANLLSFIWLRRHPGPGVAMQVRLVVSALSTGAVLYAAGWGSMLVIGYAVGIAEIVRGNGAATWRGALGWNAGAIVAGEIAIQLHWAPSILPVGIAHEAALFGFCCLVVVTRVLVLSARATEDAEAELRERSERFESLVAHASDVIGVVDTAGIITFLSPAIETLLGYAPVGLTGTRLTDVIDARDVDTVCRVLADLPTSPGSIDRRDVTFRHRNGHRRRVVVTFTSRDANGAGTVVINLHDVTVERELEERLRFDAMHDPLTGTWNRGAFTEAMEMACASSARDGGTVALLFVDIDGFKQINDTLGHDRGDDLLIGVARSIQGCLRAGNLLGRWGGDEFVVLMPKVNDPEEAIIVADRVLTELSRAATERACTTVSIGIATSTDGAHPAAALARLADEAMYTAKRTGRARWAISPSSPVARAV